MLAEAAAGDLRTEPVFDDGAAVTVVVAAEGYPVSPRAGDVITGIDDAEAVEGVTVFHAGTARTAGGDLVTKGGRVLDVTAQGRSIGEARERAYTAVTRISFPGMHYRSDIGQHAVEEADR